MVCGFIQKEEMGLHEESTSKSDTHSPPSRHVFGLFLHALLVKAKTSKKLTSSLFKCARVQLIQAIINIHQNLALWSVFLHRSCFCSFQTLDLTLTVLNNSLHSGHFGGVDLLVEEVNVNVVGNIYLTPPQNFHKGGFPTAVAPNQAVATPIIELKCGVSNERNAMTRQGKTSKVDITGQLITSQLTSHIPVGGIERFLFFFPLGSCWFSSLGGCCSSLLFSLGTSTTTPSTSCSATTFLSHSDENERDEKKRTNEQKKNKRTKRVKQKTSEELLSHSSCLVFQGGC
mmetsp:Transcript_32098/g.50243  ORF Transcript_32098/g.50243 Transcript_32098/m.50243 type:complete len:287 (+) Transcript_32098:1119-1979(+)